MSDEARILAILKRVRQGLGLRQASLAETLGSGLNRLWDIPLDATPETVLSSVEPKFKNGFRNIVGPRTITSQNVRLIAEVAFNLTGNPDVQDQPLESRRKWLVEHSKPRVSYEQCRKAEDGHILPALARKWALDWQSCFPGEPFPDDPSADGTVRLQRLHASSSSHSSPPSAPKLSEPAPADTTDEGLLEKLRGKSRAHVNSQLGELVSPGRRLAVPWRLLNHPTSDTPVHEQEASDKVTDLVALFHEHKGQLTVVGKSDSGKTIMALSLMKLLLEDDNYQPVPILFRLASWDVNKIPLRDWMIQGLFDENKDLIKEFGIDALRQAFERGWIVPVLDGFDEIKSTLHHENAMAIGATTRSPRNVRHAAITG